MFVKIELYYSSRSRSRSFVKGRVEAARERMIDDRQDRWKDKTDTVGPGGEAARVFPMPRRGEQAAE